MKKFFSFSFNLWAFIYLITTVHAQTTITNRVFPEAGDSIIFTLDTTVAGSALPQIGANQIWDYSILQSGIRRPEIYRAPNLGAGFATFPTATSMIRQGIQERYFRSNSNSFEELGYFITVGGGGGGLPIPTGPTVYSRPLVVLKSNYTYPNSFQSVYSFAITVGKDFLPDSISAVVPGDSFRLKNTITVDKKVTGWGTLKLPNRNWDALLEERISTTDTKVEAKIPFLGWTDITSLAGPFIGNLFGGGGPTKSIGFLSNDAKSYLAVINTDTLGLPSTIQYRQNLEPLQIGENNLFKLSSFFINQGSELWIQSDEANLDVRIQLIDISGKVVLEKNSNLSQNIKLNTSHLVGKIFLMNMYTKNGDLLYFQKLLR